MKEIKRAKTITIITNAAMAFMMFAALVAMGIYGSKIGIDIIFGILTIAIFMYMYLYVKTIDIANHFCEILIKEGIYPDKI
jgi:hypothetical protein